MCLALSVCRNIKHVYRLVQFSLVLHESAWLQATLSSPPVHEFTCIPQTHKQNKPQAHTVLAVRQIKTYIERQIDSQTVR